RPRVDNTSEFCRQFATPFEYLPSIEELTSALFRPFNLKIPLSPILYRKCNIFRQNFPISDYFTDKDSFEKAQFKAEIICFPEEISNWCNVALQGSEVGSSEFSRICDWDNLLRNPTGVCRNRFRSNYMWITDRKIDSSITLAGLRSDYWECLKSVLVFKGEEKPTNDGLNDAKFELISKMKAWNRCLFGDLKYIFAYAAGGSRIQFYTIDPSFNLHIISDIYNIRNLEDRVKVLVNIFNIHRIIRSMEPFLPDFVVTLAPVGVKRKPRTELEVKIAIRCILDALVALHELGYVHRDIRWDNILQLNDYSWILIDLECAGVDGESVHFDLKGWAPEAIETKVYTTKADVYMVGRLLRRVFITFSEEARAFERATTEFRLTAQEARQHSWLSDIRDYTK
ncbi:9914_t:CDS:2, partial [Funneliformis geosporum]